MKINYDKVSIEYDDVRKADIELINYFLEEISLNRNTKVLDFGCGTGNYTDKIKKITKADVYGVEPSDGMRIKAINKNDKIIYKKGDHENIPFPDNFFDFIYMTDVIHHVPDIDKMFNEFNRILKKEGKVCIETPLTAKNLPIPYRKLPLSAFCNRGVRGTSKGPANPDGTATWENLRRYTKDSLVLKISVYILEKEILK